MEIVVESIQRHKYLLPLLDWNCSNDKHGKVLLYFALSVDPTNLHSMEEPSSLKRA